MRILDIIMEAPQPSGPVPPGMKWNGTMWVPDTGPTPKKKRPRRDRKKPPIDKKPKPAPRNRKPPEDIPGKSKNLPRSPDIIDKLKYRWSKEGQSARYAEFVNGKRMIWAARLGKLTVWILRGAGIITPLYELYDNLSRLEKDFVDIADPFTGDDEYDEDLYNKARNQLWADFMVQEGAVLAAQTLALVLRYITWTAFVRRLVMFLSAGATFGIGLAAGITVEAMILWLQYWLKTPEGREWWKSSFIEPYIRYGAAALDGAWQSLVGFYNKTTKGEFKTSTDVALDKRAEKDKEPNRPNKNKRTDTTGQATQPSALPTSPPADQSSTQWPSNIRNWSGGSWIVGGTRVTDGQGYLIPGVSNVLAVQGARREALSRKLPDPLADLPAGPGEKHPGPFVD